MGQNKLEEGAADAAWLIDTDLDRSVDPATETGAFSPDSLHNSATLPSTAITREDGYFVDQIQNVVLRYPDMRQFEDDGSSPPLYLVVMDEESDLLGEIAIHFSEDADPFALPKLIESFRDTMQSAQRTLNEEEWPADTLPPSRLQEFLEDAAQLGADCSSPLGNSPSRIVSSYRGWLSPGRGDLETDSTPIISDQRSDYEQVARSMRDLAYVQHSVRVAELGGESGLRRGALLQTEGIAEDLKAIIDHSRERHERHTQGEAPSVGALVLEVRGFSEETRELLTEAFQLDREMMAKAFTPRSEIETLEPAFGSQLMLDTGFFERDESSGELQFHKLSLVITEGAVLIVNHGDTDLPKRLMHRLGKWTDERGVPERGVFLELVNDIQIANEEVLRQLTERIDEGARNTQTAAELDLERSLGHAASQLESIKLVMSRQVGQGRLVNRIFQSYDRPGGLAETIDKSWQSQLKRIDVELGRLQEIEARRTERREESTRKLQKHHSDDHAIITKVATYAGAGLAVVAALPDQYSYSVGSLVFAGVGILSLATYFDAYRAGLVPLARWFKKREESKLDPT